MHHAHPHVGLHSSSLAVRCRFYFAYCEAAFDARYIHNFQITWAMSAAAAPAPLLGAPRAGTGPVSLAASGKAAAAAPTDSVTQARRPFVAWHMPG